MAKNRTSAAIRINEFFTLQINFSYHRLRSKNFCVQPVCYQEAQFFSCAAALRIGGARRRRVAERSGAMEAKAGSRNEVSSDPGKPDPAHAGERPENLLGTPRESSRDAQRMLSRIEI